MPIQILSHEEALDHQLELLNSVQTNKQSLSKFYVQNAGNSDSNFRTNIDAKTKEYLQNQFKIKQMKWCGDQANSIYHVLTVVFMRIFFINQRKNQQGQEDDDSLKGQSNLLQHLKCTLYSPEIQLTKIKRAPERGLTSNSMKKLFIQFFQILEHHTGAIETILDKYPIILEIFTLFFRTVLSQNYSDQLAQKSSNYQCLLQSKTVIQTLLDYFDITYQIRKGLFFLHEDNLYLYVCENNLTTVYGLYQGEYSNKVSNNAFGNEKQSSDGFNFEEKQLDFLCDDRKETHISTPTPFFAQINQDTWNDKRNSTQKNKRKQSLHEMKKQFDAKMQMYQEKAIFEQEDDDQKRSEPRVHQIYPIQAGQTKDKNNKRFSNRKMSQFVPGNRDSFSGSPQDDPYFNPLLVNEKKHDVYYDSDAANKEKYYLKKLEAIQSPMPSSPEAQPIGSDNINKKMSEYISTKNQLKNRVIVNSTRGSNKHAQEYQNEENQFGNEINNMKNISKSNIVTIKYSKKFSKDEERDHRRDSQNSNDQFNDSMGSSCACSQIKAKRNMISNVLQLTVMPDFKKKGNEQVLECEQQAQNKMSKKTSRNDLDKSKKMKTDKNNIQRIKPPKKIPNFLLEKRPTSQICQTSSMRSNAQSSDMNYNLNSDLSYANNSKIKTAQYFNSTPNKYTNAYLANDQRLKGTFSGQSNLNPKINFTYTQRDSSQLNYKTDIYSSRQPVHIRTEPSRPINSINPPLHYGNVGSYNVREYRDNYRLPETGYYAQQKVQSPEIHMGANNYNKNKTYYRSPYDSTNVNHGGRPNF